MFIRVYLCKPTYLRPVDPFQYYYFSQKQFVKRIENVSFSWLTFTNSFV